MSSKPGFFKRFKWVLLIILTIIVAAGVRLGRSRKAAADAASTAPIKKGTIVESVYGIGTVVAARSFTFKSGVTSTVRALWVKEGDTVRKGKKLVDLDGTDSIHAPLDGTVTLLPIKIGETVFAQSTVVAVTDLRDRYLTVNLEQRGAVRMKQGLRARVSFESMRDQSYEGMVESVYSNDTGFLVRIGVKVMPMQILPGMTADVAIGISERKDVLLVPVAALDGDKVNLKEKGASVKELQVKLGVVDGAMAEVISSELHEGDVVVIQKKSL